jgi:hypothetical protein
MAKTFSRTSTAYGSNGSALAAGEPDRSAKAKVTNFALTRPTGQGDASEDIAPTAGIDNEIVVGVGSTSRNLFYTTDAENWTKWASPTDAYQSFVNNIGGQYNAHTLEGVLATGLELHYHADIAGTPTDTRCKFGGSTSTSSEALDRENNNLLVNGGDITPAATRSSGGGDSSNNWLHEADEIPLGDDGWRVSLKFNQLSLGGTQALWACGWSSASARVGVNFLNTASGQLNLQVGATGNVIVLNQSSAGYADGSDYRVDVTYDGGTGFTMAVYDDADVLIESDTGTASWTAGTTTNGEFTLFGRRDTVTSVRYDGALWDCKVYDDDDTLIRDWPLTADYALVDASMPANGNIQDNNLQTRSNGTTIFTPYANPGTPVDAHTYRATDGIHFARVHTKAVVDTGSNNHGHACLYSENLGLWLLAYGDQPNRGEFYSDDDGLTWTEYLPTAETRQQPIGFWDHPDGTQIVCAHDDRATFSLRTYQTTPSVSVTSQQVADSGIHRYDTSNGGVVQNAYAWINKPISGVFWGSFNDSRTTERSSISVSLDGYQYTTIHRFAADEGGLKNLTSLNGYYLGGIVDRTATDKYSQIQVRFTVGGVTNATTNRVSPGCTNLLGEDESTGATTTGSSAAGTTSDKALSAGTGGQVGDSTIQATAATTGNLRLLGDAVATTATEFITSTNYVKGTMTEASALYLFDVGNSSTVGGAGISLDGNWQLALAPVLEIASGGTSHRTDLTHGVQGDAESISFAIDRSAIYAGANITQPLPWMIGGTAMTAEGLTETAARGASWTESHTLFPASDSLQMRSEIAVMSYSGTSSDATLVWDAANNRWLLEVTGETDVTSAATVFDRNEQIDVAWTVSASGTDCVVTHGGNTYTLNGAAKSDLYSADIDFTTGDSAGAGALWAEMEIDSDGPRTRTRRRGRRRHY